MFRLACVTACAAASIFCLPQAVKASTFSTIYQFCSVAPFCADGATPEAGLFRATDGKIYGSTGSGGANNHGTIFVLDQHGTNYKERVIHSFCAKPDCPDGDEPHTTLIMDTNGALYGTAQISGRFGGGVAFKLTPNATGKKWKFTSLYDFCAVPPNCADGQSLQEGFTYQGEASGVAYDGSSPLFGVGYAGGAHNQGVVYELTFQPGSDKATETVIYDFCSQPNCSDGQNPTSKLTMDANGNLFGTTAFGGGFDPNGGVVFELSPDGHGGYAQTVLHHFCQSANCTDGKFPFRGELSIDAHGNLIGAASQGGSGGGGVVYKIAPNGEQSKQTIVYAFCSLANCADGSGPLDILLGPSGDIYGTTVGGSSHDQFSGVIFRIRGKRESVLYDFCAEDNCADGNAAEGNMALDPDGNLFGATRYGGASDAGTVFKFKP